jgi:hypothetical protein
MRQAEEDETDEHHFRSNQGQLMTAAVSPTIRWPGNCRGPSTWCKCQRGGQPESETVALVIRFIVATPNDGGGIDARTVRVDLPVSRGATTPISASETNACAP